MAKPAKKKWAQDYVVGPLKAKSAYNDVYLASLKKEHYVYVMDFAPTAVGQVFEQSFFVDISNSFWICNFNMNSYITATQVGTSTRPGFVTVLDNSRQYTLVDNLQLGQFPVNPGVRSTLPLPYPIPAGGSFKVSINYPAIFSVLSASTIQFTIEGYKVFND